MPKIKPTDEKRKAENAVYGEKITALRKEIQGFVGAKKGWFKRAEKEPKVAALLSEITQVTSELLEKNHGLVVWSLGEIYDKSKREDFEMQAWMRAFRITLNWNPEKGTLATHISKWLSFNLDRYEKPTPPTMDITEVDEYIPMDDEDEGISGLDLKVLRERLDDAILELSPPQQQAITEVFLGENIAGHVGNEVGISRQAVSQNIQRALAVLKNNPGLKQMFEELMKK